jgi:hypothetical protein
MKKTPAGPDFFRRASSKLQTEKKTSEAGWSSDEFEFLLFISPAVAFCCCFLSYYS